MAQFNLGSVPGANSLAVFILLVAVLLVRPTGLLGREA
jgi:branched-subunit amino acid ABC-type transport system permease component